MNNVKTWEEIENEFNEMCRMSCKPNFEKLPKGWITDEYQSVKWNREQVELNNQNYQKAVEDLKTKKTQTRDHVLNDIYKRIQYEIGHNISLNTAIKIWRHAYDDGCGDGFGYIKCCLDELIDLISDILEEQTNGNEV